MAGIITFAFRKLIKENMNLCFLQGGRRLNIKNRSSQQTVRKQEKGSMVEDSVLFIPCHSTASRLLPTKSPLGFMNVDVGITLYL